MIRALVTLMVVTLAFPMAAFAKGGLKKKDAKELCKRTEQLIDNRLRLPMPLAEGEAATSWNEISEDWLQNGRPSPAMKNLIEDVTSASPADRWNVLTKTFKEAGVKLECDALKDVLKMGVAVTESDEESEEPSDEDSESDEE